MHETSSFNSVGLTGFIDHHMGEEYNVIRYVADNLPALLLLVQKLAGEINLAAFLDDMVVKDSIGAPGGVVPLGFDLKISSAFLPGGSVAAHVAEADPHVQYLTSTRGDVRYALVGLDGKVNASSLPTYVDDVLEFTTPEAFPILGETGKIYVALSTNATYRWSGSTYIAVGDGNGFGNLGSTDSLVEGSFNKYFTDVRVQNLVITGYSSTEAGVPAATDGLIVALGKISNRAFNHNHDGQYSLLGHTHSIAQITGLPVFGLLATKDSVNDNNWVGTDLAVTNGGTGASTSGEARANLGLVIGQDVQPFDQDLAQIAALATTAFGRSLLTKADGPAIVAAIGGTVGLQYTNLGGGNGFLTIPIGGENYYLQFATGIPVYTEYAQEIIWPQAFATECIWAGVSSAIPSANANADWSMLLVGVPGLTSCFAFSQAMHSNCVGPIIPKVIAFGH